MIKIALVASAGGHMVEISQLEDFYKRYNHFFVTFKRADTIEMAEEKKVYFVNDPKRNPFKFFINFIKSIYILGRERPNIILTTGAGVAIPISVIGKIFGRKLIFIESFCRMKEKSLTGKILYPFADLFLVQWKEMLKSYGKKAIYVGGVFDV